MGDKFSTWDINKLGEIFDEWDPRVSAAGYTLAQAQYDEGFKDLAKANSEGADIYTFMAALHKIESALEDIALFRERLLAVHNIKPTGPDASHKLAELVYKYTDQILIEETDGELTLEKLSSISDK